MRPSPDVTGELSLDLATVRRHEMERRRQREGDQSREIRRASRYQQEELLGASLALMGFVAVWYMLFVLMTAPMYAFAGAMRGGAGLLPALIAVIWAAFAMVPTSRPGFTHQWLVPSLKNMVALFIIVFIALMFVAPEATARGLREESTWFLESFPQVAPLTWLDGATQAVATRLAGLFAAMHKLLPW